MFVLTQLSSSRLRLRSGSGDRAGENTSAPLERTRLSWVFPVYISSRDVDSAGRDLTHPPSPPWESRGPSSLPPFLPPGGRWSPAPRRSAERVQVLLPPSRFYMLLNRVLEGLHLQKSCENECLLSLDLQRYDQMQRFKCYAKLS